MTWIAPRIWLAVILAAVLGSAGGYIRGHADADQSAKVEAQAGQIMRLAAERDEFQRRFAAQKEVADHAAKQRDQARADAAAATHAAGRLRRRVAELVAGAGVRNSAAATGGAAAIDPLDLLADVLGRADERAGALAEYADRARIAGSQCERSYAALTAGNRATLEQ